MQRGRFHCCKVAKEQLVHARTRALRPGDVVLIEHRLALARVHGFYGYRLQAGR